jgi:hypothetical protein
MTKIIKISKILYYIFITLILVFFIKQGIDKYNGKLIEGYGSAIISLGSLLINSIFLIFFRLGNKLLKNEYVYLYLYEFYLFTGIVFSLNSVWILIFSITVIVNFNDIYKNLKR